MADNAYWFQIGTGVVGKSHIYKEPTNYGMNRNKPKIAMLGNYDLAIKPPGWNISKPHDTKRSRSII